MPKPKKSVPSFKSLADDREEPSLEVIVNYLVVRCLEEGKTKDDLVLLVRKSWDDISG